MVRSLEIDVVAEGVELETYLPFMEQADVQLMQGFYFDKPMPYDQFLARHTSDTKRQQTFKYLYKTLSALKKPQCTIFMNIGALAVNAVLSIPYLALVLSKILSAEAATNP